MIQPKNYVHGSTPATATITILQDSRGGLATKVHTRQDDGTFETQDYGSGTTFHWREAEVGSIRDIADVIGGLERDEHIIPGAIQKPLDRRGNRRNSVPRTGDTFFPHIDGVKQTRGSTLRPWCMIDFDSIDLPDRFDVTTDGEAAVIWAIGEYLPNCFHGAACFWQLSANAGIKPGLRVHLWFWFDRPVKGGWLADYMEMEGSPADASVLRNDVQPHYSVNPVFTNCDDPIQRREGLIEGAEAVILPEFEQRTMQATARSRGRGGALLDAAPGVDAKLALIGDGGGLAGFHKPITSAIMAATGIAAAQGFPLDREALKDRVKAAVLAAPKAPGRDVSKYLDDNILDASIRGAVGKTTDRLAAHNIDLPAHYPPVSGTLDDAQRKIAVAMGRFAADTASYQERVRSAVEAAKTTDTGTVSGVMPGVGVAAPSESAQARREQPHVAEYLAQRAAKAEQERIAEAVADIAPPASLLISTVGSGKTTEAVKIIKQMLEDNPGQPIGFSAPRHALNDEVAASLAAAVPGKNVAVWRGRGAFNPASETDRAASRTMCKINHLIEANSAAGGRADDICRRGRKVLDANGLPVLNEAGGVIYDGCPHWYACPYVAQKDEYADVWLFAHNLRTRPARRGALSGLAAVFVDESPIDAHLAGVSGKPVTLTFGEIQDVIDGLGRLAGRAQSDEKYGVATDAKAEARELSALREYLMAEENGKISGAGLPPVSESRLTWDTMEETGITAGMRKADAETQAALVGPYNRAVRTLNRLRSILKEATDGIVAGVTKTDTGVTLAWKKGVHADFRVPTMYMDATAASEVYQAMFPEITDDRVTWVDVAAPHMRVRQVIGWNGSRKKLVPRDDDPTGANNVERLRALIEVEAMRLRGRGAVIKAERLDGTVRERRIDLLVVTYKATREALEAGALPDNVEIAHFGNLTGIDRWKDVGGLIVAGSGCVGVSDVERVAEIVKGEEITPVENPAWGGWYARQHVGGRRRGEDCGPGLERFYHSDPMAEAVRWGIAEGELIQAIGRGRQIHRTADNPLDVLLLTNVPLPIEVDEFITWASLAPEPWERMAVRGVMVDCHSTAKGFWSAVGAVLEQDGKKLRSAKTTGADRGNPAPIYSPVYDVGAAARPLLLSRVTSYIRGTIYDVTRESIFAPNTPEAETLPGGGSPRAIIWWGRAKVKLGRYAVSVLYAPDADLAGIFGPDAVTAITEQPIYILAPVEAPAPRASDKLLGRFPATIARARKSASSFGGLCRKFSAPAQSKTPPNNF